VNPRATAILLALSEANRSLARARVEFLLLDDEETAEMLRETIDDNSTVMEALVRQQRKAHPVQVAS
jgi:hypothetical protein